jgi:hypothetical protein
MPKQKIKLDESFYKPLATAKFGRHAKIGMIRAIPAEEAPARPTYNRKHEAEIDNGNKNKPKVIIQSDKKENGNKKLDIRDLPKLQSRALTVYHHDMHTFDDAMTVVS